MFVHQDVIGIRGDFAAESRFSCPVFLLRTDCSQQRVANEKNVGQRCHDEHPVSVLGESAIAHLVEPERALGCPRDYAQALWSLCRGAASPAWRIGRACKLTVSADETKRVRARLFFSPEVSGC
jgi:hypothetical protein